MKVQIEQKRVLTNRLIYNVQGTLNIVRTNSSKKEVVAKTNSVLYLFVNTNIQNLSGLNPSLFLSHLTRALWKKTTSRQRYQKMITEEVIASLQRYVWPVLRQCEVLKCPVLADLVVRVNAWALRLNHTGREETVDGAVKRMWPLKVLLC